MQCLTVFPAGGLVSSQTPLVLVLKLWCWEAMAHRGHPNICFHNEPFCEVPQEGRGTRCGGGELRSEDVTGTAQAQRRWELSI